MTRDQGHRLQRIYTNQPLSEGAVIDLEENAAHHVARVLRLRAGERLCLFNGRGGEFDALVDAVTRRSVRVRVERFRPRDRESPLRLELAQGISRGKRMDFAVQKAVELGAARIVPVLVERGVVHLEGERAGAREEHWRAVAVRACEQCGRTRVPEIAPLTPLARWLAEASGAGLGLVLDPEAGRGLDGLEYRGATVSLLVGPEGGLTPQEIRQAGAAGLVAVSLGPRILRTETAAVAGLTAIQLRWGDLGAGSPPGGPDPPPT